MKYISLFLTFTFLLSSGLLFAQNTHFTTSGTIQFDKTINAYAAFKRRINKDNEGFLQPAFEAYKKNNPQFKVLKSTLAFTDNKTLFTPIVSDVVSNNMFGGDPAADQNNIVYNDLNTGTSIAQKKIFEETFLLKDSTRKISWKITDETRVIAGYTCRRANAIVLDSIYVVAFYTNEIAVSGGPESFSGLPGMILGIALPHENVTWFATKVVDNSLPPNTVIPPKKGKATNNKALRAILLSTFKDWGTQAPIYFMAFTL